jgi:hypothetical protein
MWRISKKTLYFWLPLVFVVTGVGSLIAEIATSGPSGWESPFHNPWDIVRLITCILSMAGMALSLILLVVWDTREDRFKEFVGESAPDTARPNRETREKLQPMVDAKMDEIFATIVDLREKIESTGGPERDTLRRDIRDERARYERMRKLVGHFWFTARSERKRSKSLASK